MIWEILDDLNQQVHDDHADELAELEAERAALADEVETEIVRVKAEFTALFEDRFRDRFEAWSDRMRASAQGSRLELARLAHTVEPVEWPEPAEADEDLDPLFDSTREYVEQMDRYKEHQGKPIDRRPRAKRKGE
jgi:phage gp46-like protein